MRLRERVRVRVLHNAEHVIYGIGRQEQHVAAKTNYYCHSAKKSTLLSVRSAS